MAEKTISIEFRGYWLDEDGSSSIPAESGVYCVYECTYHEGENKASLHELIYIGEADNVQERVAEHEKRPDWLDHVQAGNELCFSFGGVSWTDRERAEAALIFEHEPPENDECVDSFPFDKTTISLSGETFLLDDHFTVNTT
ncbi:MAG: GIY-YIG nuclease family protein [Anaerolineae bacterium]|jgi:hypothetical protein